jgi:hypothetical protein
MDMQACVNHISFLQVVGVPRSPSPGYEILFHPSWTLKQKRPSGVVVLMLNWAETDTWSGSPEVHGRPAGRDTTGVARHYDRQQCDTLR